MQSGSFCRSRRVGQAMGSMSWVRPVASQSRQACCRKRTKPSLCTRRIGSRPKARGVWMSPRFTAFTRSSTMSARLGFS
ncbi:hypothetical protein D3C76_1364140 [compost metagenome]